MEIVPWARVASARPRRAVIKPHSITGRQVKPGSLPGLDITPGTLPASALGASSIGQGLTLSGGVLSFNPLLLDPFQRRVTGTCPSGQAVDEINSDGTVGCRATTGTGGGTVTSLSQGTGILLSPNPITGSGTLSADFTKVQARVTGTPCTSGDAITDIAQSGAATCTAVGGAGGVASVTAGTGLSENQSTGAVTLSVANPLSLSGTTSGSPSGVISGTALTTGSGVSGITTDPNGYGGYFETAAAPGAAVYAQADNGGYAGLFQGFDGYGAVGDTTGDGLAGIRGNDGSTGGGYGGLFASAHGTGVSGTASGTSGKAGVYGADSTNASATFGYGVEGNDVSTSASSAGVYGTSAGGAGVYGTSSNGNGVYGTSTNGNGGSFTSTSGAALSGSSSGADGVDGVTTGAGHAGLSGTDKSSASGGFGGSFVSTDGTGIQGVSTEGNGVRGVSSADDGVSGSSALTGSAGVLGTSTSGYGVEGVAGAVGVEGVTGTNGTPGVAGNDNSAGGGYGGYFSSLKGTAGYFSGNVTVTGTLTANALIANTTKDFEIDDPLDPANKFLIHSAIESPAAENVYNGNITTDRRGYATVQLPDYFDAENTLPRYQLTVIGSFARAVVWSPEHDNRFVIRTDAKSVEVSWQVMALRNDPAARAARGPAERRKPAMERGRYLDPAGYGEPASLAIYQAAASQGPTLLRHPATLYQPLAPAAQAGLMP